MNSKSILNMNAITREFPGVRALDNVDFDLYEGEIHILCGENGAGKSTLIKILAGTIQPTSGEIYLNGRKIVINNPFTAEHLGISIVYQELSLSPSITVAENIFLGREYKNPLGLLDRNKMHEEAVKFLKMLNCDVNPGILLKCLPIAKQQLVQIAKAISLKAKILIMDEPFSALGEEDANNLFGIMENLKKSGVSIIYIDHRIDNFFKIGDRITVLRDGKKINTAHMKDLNKDEIIKMMVGRSIDNIFPKYNSVCDDTMVNVVNVTSKKVKNINFSVSKGEIFGIGGLVGSGRTEIMRAVFGLDKKYTGYVEVDGKKVNIKGPIDAIRSGIGYVPEDRKLKGLVLKKSVRFNGTLVCISDFSRLGLLKNKSEKERIWGFVRTLNIKTPGIDRNVINLSGGNQQKVVLSKWLMMKNLKVLLLDEPTRGVDVGAKFEIYKLINELANRGIAIILITSELPELIGLCDRVAILKNGRITGILGRNEITQEAIVNYGV